MLHKKKIQLKKHTQKTKMNSPNILKLDVLLIFVSYKIINRVQFRYQQFLFDQVDHFAFTYLNQISSHSKYSVIYENKVVSMVFILLKQIKLIDWNILTWFKVRFLSYSWSQNVDEINVCGEAVSYTHLRAHETSLHLVCRLLLEKKPHPVT